MTTQVQNKGLRNAELNVGGKIVRSDDNGVFDVDDVMAGRLLGLPGFSKPKLTVELRDAYAEYKRASETLAAAQTIHAVAKLGVAVAQAQADRGQGTALPNGDSPAAPQEAPKAPAPQTAATPTPQAQDAAQEPPDEPGDVDDPVARAASGAAEAAAKLKARLGVPTMRWKLDDLLIYAAGAGVDADSSWQKADILKAIESVEEDEG